MQCDYLGKCGSCTLYDKDYEQQLEYKLQVVKELFAPLYQGDYDVIRSKEEAFRARSEFKLWHDGDRISYAMNSLTRQGVVMIESCSIVSQPIQQLMPKLLDAIKSHDLDYKLFNIDFLSSLSGEMVVSLIYHRKLDELWQQKAQIIANDLDIHIIGRSRKQKVVIGQDYITEVLPIMGEEFRFVHIENSFTQPNSEVNIKMVEWVKSQIGSNSSDLLELYCGAGNFTLPLSKNYNRVVATEISKSSIHAALRNCELNDIDNITFLRMSSEEFVQAYNKERTFTRLKGIDLETYDIDTIFLDPPRSGLDDTTRALSQRFDTVIYISCNPETLKRDLETLGQTHDIKQMAVFDQFAYSNHLEMGAVLKRKEA